MSLAVHPFLTAEIAEYAESSHFKIRHSLVQYSSFFPLAYISFLFILAVYPF